MDKKTLSERDIVTKCILPALQKSGWDLDVQVREEFPMSAGRVIVKGSRQQPGLRGKDERADIVLFHKLNIPIAVIEAKRNDKTLGSGIQQALRYAERLDVPLAYSTNGDSFLESDISGTASQVEREIPLLAFPSPEELWLPFGGHADPEVAEAYPVALRTTDLGALHLQHAIHVLRPEGRAALVLPDSALSSNGIMTRVREKLLEECDIHTIVRLPAGVFAPHHSSRSCILFFTRGRPTREIWYYEQQLPEGLKAWSKTKPLKGEDFERLRAFWNQREETAVAFRVSLDAVQARNYNLDIRNPLAGAASSIEIAGPPSPLRLDHAAKAEAIVAAQRGAVRVRGVRLRDYRGFAALDLELPKTGAAVLIGINGAGKSTVLDAVAQVLAPLAALASGGTARSAEIQIGPDDVRVGEELARDGVTLDIEGGLQHWEVRANRAKGTSTTAREIAAYARVLTERLMASTATNLPVLCYYPAKRGLGDESGGKRTAHPYRQQRTYDRAFRRGLGPFQDFLVWFRDEEDLENQVRLRSDPTYRNPRLEVVRRAVQRFLAAIGPAPAASPSSASSASARTALPPRERAKRVCSSSRKTERPSVSSNCPRARRTPSSSSPTSLAASPRPTLAGKTRSRAAASSSSTR